MKKFVAAAAVAAAMAVPMSAMAAKVGDSGDVQFNGTVTHTCTITVGDSGTLTANAAADTLTGAGGSATVAATGNTFKLFVDAPVMGASNPTSASSTTSSVSGDLTTSNSDASGANVSKGSHSVNVGMTATAGDFFEEGDYAATVTLRCE